MPRVIGIDIPGKKRLIISLRYIHGVGPRIAKEICEKLDFDPDKHASELTEEDLGRINSLLQNDYTVEGDLRRQVQNNIKRLISIQAYRGIRHRKGLPVRGQRTQSNTRTRKGKKKTIAGKKKPA